MKPTAQELALAKTALARLGYVNGTRIDTDTVERVVHDIESQKPPKSPKLIPFPASDSGRRTYVPRVHRGCSGFSNRSFLNSY